MWKKLYYFLGSFYFAVALIGASALIVAAGTFAESITDSHKYAAQFAYQNPVFLFLLSLFFVNIFISSLRRWPFERRHIPFLITHLGLLMIISGVMVKNIWGTQGQMGLIEGASSSTLLFPERLCLHVKKKGERALQFPLNQIGHQDIKLIHFSPNCREKYETWIKGNFAYISGIKPFPVYRWDHGAIQVSAKVKIPHDDADHWNLYAYHTSDVKQLAKRVYLDGLKIRLTERQTGKIVSEGPLDEKLLSFDEQKIVVQFANETLTIPLSGDQALLNLQEKTTYWGHYPIAVDLIQTPKITLVQDESGATYFFAFDSHGQMYSEEFSSDQLSRYLSYDRGFGGYSVQVKLPFSHRLFDREHRENALYDPLRDQLKEARELSPPLQLFKDACVNCDFTSSFILFLTHWHGLFPNHLPAELQEIINRLNWSSISERDRKGALFGAHLLADVEEDLEKGQDLRFLLKEKKWPLASLMEQINEPNALLTALVQQVFMIADELSENQYQDSAEMLSVLFRAYGIHPNAFEQRVTPREEMVFECPLSLKHESTSSKQKLEENRPMVGLRINDETVTLAYDPYGVGLMWPILNGEYLVGFRSETEEIPYNIRLRDARQINYPGTNQAYSYESDLLITDIKREAEVEKTVSMNTVHQTWDGYRFYLANISPSDETAAQRIQLVVNKDPAKYWLTYPGGFLVALGILLLFTRRQRV